MTLTFYEAEDPMLAGDDQVYTENAFFSKWPAILADQDGWDWKEMKRRLKEKKPEEVWYVVKSVDTLPSEDGQAPYVPNFICFVQKDQAKKGDLLPNAPRLSLKPAVKTPDMDPEAFVTDDIVDMKGTHHWRRLEGHPNVRVLCEVNEDTSAKKAFDFSQFGAVSSFTSSPAPAASSGGFSFGATAAAPSGGFSFGAPAAGSAAAAAPSGGFSFGAPASGSAAAAASSGGFSFGAPASGGGFDFGGGGGGSGVGKKRKAEEAAEGQPGAKRFAGPDPSQEPVFPVLWQENTVEEMEEEMASGQKVVASLRLPCGEKVEMVLECDLDFIDAPEAERRAEVKGFAEAHVLERNEAFKALRARYEDMPFAGSEEEVDKRQEAFRKERAALLAQPEVAAKVEAIHEKHGEAMYDELWGLCKKRKAKLDAARATLEAIVRDRKEGKMFGRGDFVIDRVFPEKDSKGDYCAFRPSKRINKSVGKADNCYPEVYKMVNPFTGEVRES